MGLNFISIRPAVVLTTHSVQETEESCSRLAIRDDAQMRCVKSDQHLKDTFLSACTLDSQFKSMASLHVIDLVSKRI